MDYSWILEGRLAVGAAPDDYASLERDGFNAALSLQEDSERGPFEAPLPPGFEAVRVPIRDGIVGGVPTVDQIARAVEAVHRFLTRDRVLYVHCFAGVGRSPTVCIAYLARHGGRDLDEALEFVTGAHPVTCPTLEQMETVRRYLAG